MKFSREHLCGRVELAGGPGKREAEATQDPNWAAVLGPTMLASLFRGQRVKKDREGVVAGDDVGLQVTLKTYSWKELMAEESPSTGTVYILYWLYRGCPAKMRAVEAGRDGPPFPAHSSGHGFRPEVKEVSCHSLASAPLWPLIVTLPP